MGLFGWLQGDRPGPDPWITCATARTPLERGTTRAHPVAGLADALAAATPPWYLFFDENLSARHRPEATAPRRWSGSPCTRPSPRAPTSSRTGTARSAAGSRSAGCTRTGAPRGGAPSRRRGGGRRSGPARGARRAPERRAPRRRARELRLAELCRGALAAARDPATRGLPDPRRGDRDPRLHRTLRLLLPRDPRTARPISSARDVLAEIDTLDEPYLVFTDNNLTADRAYAEALCRGSCCRSIRKRRPAPPTSRATRAWSGRWRDSGRQGRSSASRRSPTPASGATEAHAPALALSRGGPPAPRPRDSGERELRLRLRRGRPGVFDRTLAFITAGVSRCATFHILTPYPGTPLFEKLEAEGRIRPATGAAMTRRRRLPPRADDRRGGPGLPAPSASSTPGPRSSRAALGATVHRSRTRRGPPPTSR